MLALDFDQAFDPNVLASGTILSSVACPSAVNEWAIRPFLPQGPHGILIDGIDFDIRFKFTYSGRDVTVTPESDFTLRSIELSPDFDPVVRAFAGTFEEMLAKYAGVTRAQIEEDVNAGVVATLGAGNVPAALEQLLEHGIPVGYRICSMQESSGILTITTRRLCVELPVLHR